MTTYEQALKKQYEAQLQANRTSVESSVRQAESALPQYAQQRETGARQAYVRMRQGETALKTGLAQSGINGGETETSRLKLQTQYGNEISALNENYKTAADQVSQQVYTLRLQGQKQESDAQADYYAKLAELAVKLQEASAQAAAKAAVQSSKTAKKETAAAATKQTLSEKISQKKAQSAQKAAAKSKTQNSGGYVLVDGVKLTPEELESRLESGSIVKTNRGGYAFAYQRYPYWRTMITK